VRHDPLVAMMRSHELLIRYASERVFNYMRIAIIGAGVSGLVCAYRLCGEHDVTVFEAEDHPGGHVHTVDVETEAGVVAVDTGFIVFNDRNYPNFERLLGELGVATQPSTMTFGVSDGAGFEYNGASPNGLFACRRNLLRPTFHRMIADLVRFNRDARALLRSDRDPSLREWLADGGYSEGFVEKLIVPQAAAVWSADPRQMWSFPARFLVEFFDNHGVLGFSERPQWKTVVGGSRVYVSSLLSWFAGSLRLSTPVQSVRRVLDGAVVTPVGGEPSHFDAVVIATHSDQALSLLADPSERERSILGAIPYQRNEAVLHTDRSLLPRRRRAWASWNYHLDRVERGVPTVTYHMNKLQSLRADRELCVTLNRTDAIDPAKIIRKISYSHPVYTREGVAAQARVGEISGHNRTHYCGAYWGWGFHEDGVVSALRVAREVGVSRLESIAAGAQARSTKGRSATAGSPCARTSSATASRCCMSIWMSFRGCWVGGWSPVDPGSCGFGVATTSMALGPCATRCERLSPTVSAGCRTDRSVCSPSCARSGTASTRSASTTASTPASGSRRSSPRSRARRGVSATPTCSGRTGRVRCCAPGSTSDCTCRRSWAWTRSTCGAHRPRVPRPRSTSRVSRAGIGRSTQRCRWCGGP
jgi:uncharacterized protein